MNLLKTRRSFLTISPFIALALAEPLAGCSAASIAATIPQIIAGVEDASLILGQIGAFVATYAQANPSAAATVAKIELAIADARQALDAVVRAGAAATDILDANLQQALVDFSAAFAAVIALATQIGVQVSAAVPRGTAVRVPATATASAKLIVAEPMLLKVAKAPAKAPATPAK
jgi:hypothetical protein